jgi:hypothetical protein
VIHLSESKSTMNASKIISYISSSLLTVVSSQAQGTFQNLDFELANPGSASYSLNMLVTSALPFWSVYYGSVQQTQILYNEIAVGSTSVSLLSTSSVTYLPIDGTYSVLLQGGLTASAASISQTGLIPAGTQSLLFEAADVGFHAGSLEVLVGTQIIPFAAVGTGPNYTLYAANISAWAGQTEQLTFSALEDLSVLNNWEIDDITFSTTAVLPGPGALALMLMGGLGFGMRRWRAEGF